MNRYLAFGGDSTSPRNTAITVLVAILSGIAIGFSSVMVRNTILLPLMVISLLVVVLSIFRTELGLMLLVFISYTRLSDNLILYYGAPSVAKFFVLLLVAVIIVRWMMYGETPTGWTKAAWLIGAYGFVCYVSLLYSQDFVEAQFAFIDWVKDAIIGLVVVILLKDGKNYRQVIWVLVGVGLFLGGLSVFQFITGTYSNIYGGFAQASNKQIIGNITDRRVGGPIGDPNTFSQVLLVIIPLAMDRLWREKSTILKIISGLTLTSVLITVVLTYSRGGFVSLVVMIGTFIYFYRPEFSRVVLVMLILRFVIKLVSSKYIERMGTLTYFLPFSQVGATEDPAFSGRISEMLVGIQMFSDYPLFGVGLNNYNVRYLSYSEKLGIDPRREARSAHSLYVEVAAELGLMGLIAFFSLLYFTISGLIKSIKDFTENGEEDLASITRAFTVGFIGYLSAALFIHGAYPRYFWLLIGIGLSVPNIVRRERLGWKADNGFGYR
jgi:putative inorganic carbon (HCO3(-)) transporter